MNQRQFENRCYAALNADPIRTLAVELAQQGMTESQLMERLAKCPRLPDPFKVALQNKYRDFRLTF